LSSINKTNVKVEKLEGYYLKLIDQIQSSYTKIIEDLIHEFDFCENKYTDKIELLQ